jgi:DNA-binding MarR family transcriptional regulator
MIMCSGEFMKKNQSDRRAEQEVVRVGHIVVLLERMLRKELTEALLPANLTVQQYGALFFIGQREKITNANFAKQFFIAPQSANEIISVLEKKALILKEPNENHGRIIEIRLSKEGKRLLSKADAAVLKIEQRMLDSVPHAERRRFHDHLVSCLSVLLPPLGDESLAGEILRRASLGGIRENPK